MAAEANVLINIEGKPYVLSKHLKKSNLIEIITKLHEDLVKIKLFTKNQIDCKTQLQKLKLENKELQTVLAKFDKSNKGDSDSQNDLLQEQAEIRKRMKENFEKKARYTSQIYEEKIDMLRKQLTEIEKDRETFAEVIQTKQNVIGNLKRETDRLKKEMEKTEYECKEAINVLKKSQDADKQRIDKDKQKIVKEMEVLQRTYIDLDKIRKYLEKNNASLKTSLAEANSMHEERMSSLTLDFERREENHLKEIKTLRRDVELIIEEAESKIEKIEEKLRKTGEEHQSQINVVLKENEHFKGLIKSLEQNEQSLKNELNMNKELISQTKKNYEEALHSLTKKHNDELTTLDKGLKQLKHGFESKIFELQGEKDKLEAENTEKTRQIAQLQSENDLLNEKRSEIKKVGDENNKKYLENYNILREKVETMKSNYEAEKYNLNTEIYNRDKVIDDLTIQNERLEKQVNNLNFSNEYLKQENEKEMDKIYLKIKNHKESYSEELQKVKETHNRKLKLIDNDLKQSKFDYEVLEKRHKELLQNKQNLEKSCEGLRETLEKIQHEYKTEISQMRENFKKDGKYLKQDFEAQTQEILDRNVKISDLEFEITKLKSTNKEIQQEMTFSQEKNEKEINRLKQAIEDNSQFYKNDLQNMKQLLSYKEETIKELEENLTKHQDGFNISFMEMQKELKSQKLNTEQKIQEINSKHEIQKQKYDILIYEFYKELKEKISQTDELVKIKSNLELENSNLKKRNSDFIVNISKQKEKFQHDSEFMRLLEYLVV